LPKKKRKTKPTKGFPLQPTKLHLIILMLATRIVGMLENNFFHWLEDLDCLARRHIDALLKLHEWMLLIHMTKMDCASLQQFSKLDNNAISYAIPTFSSSLDETTI
jgi:hypothetical protein